MNSENRKCGIMREYKNLKVSPELQMAKEKKQREIQIALLRGRSREENHQIYYELFDREVDRLIKKLSNIYCDSSNVMELINGYMLYITQNRDNFDYGELRKYRKGVLESIQYCATQYGSYIIEDSDTNFECDDEFECDDDNDDEFKLMRL